MRLAACLGIVVLTAVSGCLDSSAGTQEGPSEEETDRTGQAIVPAPAVDQNANVSKSFGWTAAVAPPGVPVTAGVLHGNQMDIEVAPGVRQLTVKAEWTCPTPVCPVHVYVYGAGSTAPVGPMADAGATEGPLEFTFDDPADGTWTVTAAPEMASAMVTGTFTATVV